MVKCSKRHTASARGSFVNTAAEKTSSSKTGGLLGGTQGDVREKLMISASHRQRNAKTLNALPYEGGARGGSLRVPNPTVKRSSHRTDSPAGPAGRGPLSSGLWSGS